MSLLNHLNVLFLACLILLKLVKYPSCLVFDLPRRRRRIVLALDIFIVFTELIFSLGHINLAKSARQHLFCLVLPFLYMLLFGACPVAQLFPEKKGFLHFGSALQRVFTRVIFVPSLKKRHTFASHFSSHASTSTKPFSVQTARSSRHFSPWLLSKEIKPTSCAPSSTSSPCGSSKTALTYLRVDTSFKP